MIRHLFLPGLLGLTLTACGGPPKSGIEAECARKALDDPAVKDAIMRSNTNLQQVRAPALYDLDYRKKQATQRCLAEHGLAPRGGVEPVNLR